MGDGREFEKLPRRQVEAGLVGARDDLNIQNRVPAEFEKVALVSAALWIAAFALFVAVYWPIVTRAGD